MKQCSFCGGEPVLARDGFALCERHVRIVEDKLGSLSYALQLSPRALELVVEHILALRPASLAA